MSYTDFDERLTSDSVPATDATLTVRVIKSFEYRTEKSLVLQHVNLEETSVAQLKLLARQVVSSGSGWKPYRNVLLGPSRNLVESGLLDLELDPLDTIKLYSQAHGAKTTNLIINLDHDDWILDNDERLLSELGFRNETEVSFFNRELYEAFKVNPTTKWESAMGTP